MTTSSTTPPPLSPARKRFDVCPPWCSGHGKTGDDWILPTAGGAAYRFHEGVDAGVGGVSAVLVQTEYADQPAAFPFVDIYCERDPAKLTPGEARAFAYALLSMADTADSRRDPDRERNAFQIGRDYERGQQEKGLQA